MTDRFSPSMPSNGKVTPSSVRRVAGVNRHAGPRPTGAWTRLRSMIRSAARSGPALVTWRFDYGAVRLGLETP